jgi:hypothetical protein
VQNVHVFIKKNESVLAEVRIPYISRLLKKEDIRWMKQQQTFNSFQEFQLKIKNLKPIAVDVSFKAYPMVQLPGGSNMAERGTFQEENHKPIQEQNY